MTKRYLFPTASPHRAAGGPRVRGSQPMSAKRMSQILKHHANNAGEHTEISMHYFRSGGAVSRALAGDSTSIVMQRALRENPRMALRYIPLVEVSRSIPRCGEGDVMVEGISQTSTGSSATCLGASRAGRGQPSKTARCLEQDHNW